MEQGNKERNEMVETLKRQLVETFLKKGEEYMLEDTEWYVKAQFKDVVALVGEQ